MVELTSRATRRLRGRPRDREGRAGAAPRRRRGKRREAVETLEPGGVGGSGGAEAREGMGHRRVGARADSQCVAVSLCVRAHARCYFFPAQNVDMCVKKRYHVTNMPEFTFYFAMRIPSIINYMAL